MFNEATTLTHEALPQQQDKLDNNFELTSLDHMHFILAHGEPKTLGDILKAHGIKSTKA